MGICTDLYDLVPEFFCWAIVRLYGTPVMAQVPLLFVAGGRTTLNLSRFILFISQLAGTTLPQPHSPICTIRTTSLLLAANSGNFVPFLCSLNTPSLAQIFVIGDLLGSYLAPFLLLLTHPNSTSSRPYSALCLTLLSPLLTGSTQLVT
jgi:hypothetical protein